VRDGLVADRGAASATDMDHRAVWILQRLIRTAAPSADHQ
jgi:hypothetical protein